MDYTWPSIYFSYFFFALSLALGIYFLVRSWKDGYWGKDGEEIKYQIFDETAVPLPHGRGSEPALPSRDREGAVAEGKE